MDESFDALGARCARVVTSGIMSAVYIPNTVRHKLSEEKTKSAKKVAEMCLSKRLIHERGRMLGLKIVPRLYAHFAWPAHWPFGQFA